MNNTRLALQVGVEIYDGAKRTVRLTPVDQKLPDMPEQVESIVKMIAGIADASDAQPGDGEVDIAIGKASSVVDRFPALAFASNFLKAVPGEANVFIRLKEVAA